MCTYVGCCCCCLYFLFIKNTHKLQINLAKKTYALLLTSNCEKHKLEQFIIYLYYKKVFGVVFYMFVCNNNEKKEHIYFNFQIMLLNLET